MSLALTEQQETERMKAKVDEFRKGLEELEKATGMTIMAVMQPSLTNLAAQLRIVPIPPKENGDKVL